MIDFAGFQMPRGLARLMTEQPPRYMRPPLTRASEVERWLRDHEWKDGIAARLQTARRLMFVRFLVDGHVLDEWKEPRT